MRYSVIRFDEKEKWNEEVKSMDNRDVYYFVDYCCLYQMLGDGDPYLFVYEEDEGKRKIIYPFLKRPIKSGFLSERYFDITTPFGYGGPLSNSSDRAFIRTFREMFNAFCQEEKIVTEFIRFHPLLRNEDIMQPFVNVQFVRDMVFIDLRKEPEDIFRSMSKSNRNRVRKARKEGLFHKVLETDEALIHLDHFVAMYYETMDRNDASRHFYYPKEYFVRLLTDLAPQVKMAAVFYKEKMVTADLILCEGDFIHCHVNAGDPDYFSMGANALLNCETALWGRRHGYQYVYLGGGYTDGDSLFTFKRRFNPTGIIPYYIGTKVHHQPVYRELVHLWKKHNKELNTSFFPLYRQ